MANKKEATKEVANVSYRPEKFSIKRTGKVSAIFNEIKPFGNGGITIVNNVSATFGMEPSQDFKNAMRRLLPHLLMYMEVEGSFSISLEEHYEKVLDESLDSKYPFKSYFITGVTVKEEGVAIQGGKFLKNKQVMPINTPLIRYGEGSAEVTYPFLSDLQSMVEDAVGEFIAYLNGKQVLPAQQQVDFSPQVEELKQQQA